MEPFTENNLAARFLMQAAAGPDRTALRFEGSQMSYGELAVRAGRVAAGLLAVIERPGSRVGIFAQRSPQAYAGVLGACMAGFTYVPIGVDLPVERQLEMIQRARLAALVVDRPLDPQLVERAGVKIIIDPDALDVRPLDEARPVQPDDPAYLLFTSGTTGVPKAVVVTAGNVAHFLGAMRARCPIHREDRVSQFYDLTFDPSVLEIFLTLGAGASLHVVPPAQRSAPANFIRNEALTVWASVPSVIYFLQRLEQLQRGAFPSLRLSMFGGEPLSVTCVEAWRRAAPFSAIDNQYGPTEATVGCMAEWIDEPLRITPGRATIAVGTPFPGTHAGIVDPEGRFLAAGETGELALSGPQLGAGYFDDPAMTRRRFRTLKHPELGSARWYLTGDLACRDTDGHFHVLGRLDHQVKILGRRVELEEIEFHVRAVTGCDAAVVAWPVQDGSALGVIAFVAGGEWNPESTLSTLEALGRRLPPHMIPRQFRRRSALPLGPTGKLDRRALVQELEQNARVAG